MEKTEHLINLMHSVISNKFELILSVEKGSHSVYKVIENNNLKNPMAPLDKVGDYCDFLNNYVFKFLVDNTKSVQKRFYFEEVFKYLSPGYEYSFTYDFKVKDETLNKRFAFYYINENEFVLLIEDYTKYKLENLENSLRSIDNK
ncbi:MAG: hypothetical protein K6G28_03275, partial [Acholeplasmatales bacterium]|nr:hypothetical protein [Acholeplasmatales bacterium]